MQPPQLQPQQIFAWKSTLFSSYESCIARGLAVAAACFSFVDGGKRPALDAASL
jgi:hypothetical protein